MAVSREEAQAVDDALARLPPDYVEVIELIHRDHYSFSQAAEAMGRSDDAVRRLWTRRRAADARDRSQGMKDDEQTAPEDPLVSSLTAYHESRAKGSTEIRPSDAPAEGEPEFAEQLLRAQACIRLLDRRWSGPNRTGDTGEFASPLLSASSGILSPGDSAPARIGRFQIRRELGRGAFGIVLLALDPALGREVALKVARPETTVTPQFRRRFLREAQAAAALTHPNVVSVFESGEWGPICYIAQEYSPGRRWRRGSSSEPNPSLWRRRPRSWRLSPRRSIMRTSMGSFTAI